MFNYFKLPAKLIIGTVLLSGLTAGQALANDGHHVAKKIAVSKVIGDGHHDDLHHDDLHHGDIYHDDLHHDDLKKSILLKKVLGHKTGKFIGHNSVHHDPYIYDSKFAHNRFSSRRGHRKFSGHSRRFGKFSSRRGFRNGFHGKSSFKKSKFKKSFKSNRRARRNFRR